MKKKNKKLGQLTLFAEDSPANLSPQQEKEKAQKMTVIYGRKCYESYGKLSPLGLLVKMFLESSTWTAGRYSKKYTLIWKAKGTPFNRLLFQLWPSELGIEETEFGLLPTMTASELPGGYATSYQPNRERRGAECKTQNDGPDNSRINSNIISQQNIRQHKEGLFNQSAGSNQTNTNIDSQGLPNMFGDNSKAFQKRMNHPRGVNIVEFLQRENGGKSDGLKLQPGFAEAMMGFPLGTQT
jgi:hypothetical protein